MVIMGITKAIKPILILSILYLVFRSLFSFPIFSDENIYINMAKAVKEGLLPYRDFFYAHPPFQLLLFQPVLLLFGANFFAVKVFMVLLSVGTAILTYLIAKHLFGEKAAFYSFLFFLFFPAFLIFSNQALGMFESLFFLLSGFYFLIKKKPIVSSVFLVAAIFTRYLAILLLPFLLYYLYSHDKKLLPRFAEFLILAVLLTGVAFTAFFGENFLVDTVAYHAQANISGKIGIARWLDQYLVLGFFTTFLSFVAIAFALMKKERKILLFGGYPLLYDILVLLGFKAVTYHYFLLVLPFLFMAVGAAFAKSSTVRAPIAIMLAFSIIANASNIAFYLDESNHRVFPELAAFVKEIKENLDTEDTISGESRSVNYVSFVTGAKIANNYFDFDFKFVNFAGREKIFSNVAKTKPKLIVIENKFSSIGNFKGNYTFVSKWEIPNYYSLSLYKLA